MSNLVTQEHTVNNYGDKKQDKPGQFSKSSLLQVLRKLDGRLLGFLNVNTDKLRPCEASRVEEDETLALHASMGPKGLANRGTKRSASKSITELSTKTLRKKKRQSSIGSCIQLDLTKPTAPNHISPYYTNQRYNSKYVAPLVQGTTPSVQKKFQCTKPNLGLPKRSLQESSLRQQSVSRMGVDESSYLPPGPPTLPLRTSNLTSRPTYSRPCRNKSMIGSGCPGPSPFHEESRSRLGNSSDSLQLPQNNHSLLLSKSKSYKRFESMTNGPHFEEQPLNHLSSKELSTGTNQKLVRRPNTISKPRVGSQEQVVTIHKENIDIMNAAEPSRVAFKDMQSTREPLSELSQYSNKPKPILKQASDRKLTYLKQEM